MKAHVYSYGLVNLSVCAPEEMERAAIEEDINGSAYAAGPGLRWAVSERAFSDGCANPVRCEQDAARRHWLLSC